jgi:hypothetical protein
MVKAYGHNVHFLLGREATPGTKAAAFTRIPLISSGLGKKRSVEGDSLAGMGRDPQKVWQGISDVSGDVRAPLDLRYLGFFLTGLFGDAVTTEDDGVFTHTFKSGGLNLPTFSLETAHKGPGKFDLALGVMVNSMTMDMANTAGRAGATFSLLGMTQTTHAATQGGVPEELVHAPCSNLQGKIKKGGVVLGDINSGSLTYSNNMEVFRSVGSSGEVDQTGIGESSTSGSISTRFSNRDFFELAESGTPLDLEFSYELSAGLKLVITVHEAILDLPAPAVDGPGGYGADFNFTAVRNAGTGVAVTAVLINNLAAATYA